MPSLLADKVDTLTLTNPVFWIKSKKLEYMSLIRIKSSKLELNNQMNIPVNHIVAAG